MSNRFEHVTRIPVVLAILHFLFILPVPTTANDLITEIKQVRSHNRGNQVDVTSLVEQYLKIGTATEDAISFLENNGFRVTRMRRNRLRQEQFDAIYAARYDLRKWYSFGFGDVIRIIVYSSGERVSSISGYISYMAL